jgi:hypothetical protein
MTPATRSRRARELSLEVDIHGPWDMAGLVVRPAFVIAKRPANVE